MSQRAIEPTTAPEPDLERVGLEPSVRHRTALGQHPEGLLQRRVENELSKRLLRGEYQTGDHVVVEYDADAEGESKLVFQVVEQEPIAVELPVDSSDVSA